MENHLKYSYQVMLVIFHPYCLNTSIDKISLAFNHSYKHSYNSNTRNVLNSLMQNLKYSQTSAHECLLQEWTTNVN